MRCLGTVIVRVQHEYIEHSTCTGLVWPGYEASTCMLKLGLGCTTHCGCKCICVHVCICMCVQENVLKGSCKATHDFWLIKIYQTIKPVLPYLHTRPHLKQSCLPGNSEDITRIARECQQNFVVHREPLARLGL